jgi:hypothetical protein
LVDRGRSEISIVSPYPKSKFRSIDTF